MDRLTEHERAAVLALITHQPVERRERLISDLAVAEVKALNSDRSILRFHLPDYGRAEGQNPLCPEGAVIDRDGAVLEVVVYTDRNHRLFELELIRYAEGDVIGPDWATFAVQS